MDKQKSDVLNFKRSNKKNPILFQDLEEKYKILFNNITDAVYIHSLTPEMMPDKFIEANETAYKSLGFTKEEFLNISPYNINPPEEMNKIRKRWDEFIRKGNVCFETMIVSKTGKKIPYKVKLHMIEIKNQKYVLGIASDISEKVKANEKIKIFDNNYKTIFNGIDDSVILIDIKTKKIIDMNSAATERLGINHNNKDKFTLDEFATLASPYSSKDVYKWVEKAINEGPQIFEWKRISKNSELEWMEVSLKKVTIDNKECLLAVSRNINHRKQIEEELLNNYQTIKNIMNGIIQTMEKLVEKKDIYTVGHQRRTAELASAIAKEIGLNEHRINGIYTAALIHDIGKIFVSGNILNKIEPLTKDEYDVIKTHSIAGYEILKSIDFPWPIALMIKQHHERINGSGYPDGLKKDDILLESRIIAVADVVEAITFERPYRVGFGIEKALEEILKNKGVLYDERVVDVCMKLFKSGKYKFEYSK
ncbi:MAG: HD domain-containing protein [Candidatus Goldbacteria bacterium]|nr:HD domain-containing protein [Candidatus Goldiibacteriota bacterium]